MRLVRTLEPVWWGLFAAGGMIAAFLLPTLIFLNSVAGPAGWLRDMSTYDFMARLLRNPVVKVYLIILIVPTLFHAAHRMTFLPHEMTLHVSHEKLGVVAYTLAGALSAVAIALVIIAP